MPTARKRTEEVFERPELVGPALKPKELQQGRKRANAMVKAKAEEIGEATKKAKPPRLKLEGPRPKTKESSQER